MGYTRLTTLSISGSPLLTTHHTLVYTDLTTFNYPVAWLVDGLDYSLEPGIDRFDYPSDGWLTHLTTHVTLGCHALTYLTTLSMAG
jgi:hypothetical protein